MRRELRRRLWEREVESLIAGGDTYEDLVSMHEFALGTAVQADKTPSRPIHIAHLDKSRPVAIFDPGGGPEGHDAGHSCPDHFTA